MKCSKAAIHRKTHRIPEIKFEDQRLTSFAGLVVYQSLFARIAATALDRDRCHAVQYLGAIREPFQSVRI